MSLNAPALAPPGAPRGSGVNITQLLNFVAIGISVLLVALPLLAVVYGAFQTSTPDDPAAEFTMANVLRVLTDASIRRALGYTVLIAGLTTVLAVGVGATLAYIIGRTDVPGRKWLENLVTINNYVPPFVGAVAWIALGAPVSGFLNILWRTVTGSTTPLFSIYSLGGIVWVMFLFYVPYAFLYTIGSFRALDPALEEAAAIHGARGWTIVRTVTLPLIRPALVSASVLIFVLAAELFSIPGLLGGPAQIQTLAYRILLAVRLYPSRWELAAAMGLILLIITLLGLYLYRWSVGNERRFITVTGKGYRARRLELGRGRWLAALLCWLYVLVGVALPMGAIVLGSFLRFFTPVINARTLTTGNWTRMMGEGLTWTALRNTTLLSVMAPTAVILLAGLLTYLILRVRIPGRNALDYIMTLPVGVPGIVFAIGLIWVYVRTPLYATIWILFLAFVTKFIPQGMRNLNAGLLQIHPELEESSIISGASQWRTLWKITLPLLQPTIVATWILVFVSTVRELSASVMLYTARTTTFSVLIWDYLESGEYQKASVLSVIQVVLIVVLVLIARRIMSFGLAKQEAEGR